MALCGYRGTVTEFIECCDSNLIAETIRAGLNSKKKTTNNEFRSWRDGLQKLANFLRLNGNLNQMILGLGITCELRFGNSRADVILTGRNDGLPVAVVMELKQWSEGGIEPGSSADSLMAHVGNEAREDKTHPVLQATSYSASIRNEFEENKLTLYSIAFLPNMESNELISRLESVQEGRNLFLKRNIQEFGDFLRRVFTLPDTKLDALKMIIEPEYAAPRLIPVETDSEIEEEWENEHELEIDGRSEVQTCGFIGSSKEFIDLCDRNQIADKIKSNLGINLAETHNEFRSWREGLYRISVILRDVGLPLGVACEVKSQAGCIDVILSGYSEDGTPLLFVIELKQWSVDGVGEAYNSEQINALVGAGGLRPTRHPLLQCNGYRSGLKNYKMYFNENPAALVFSVAFLPNFSDTERTSGLCDERYNSLSDNTSFVFTHDNHAEFRQLIIEQFNQGDESAEIIQEVIDSPRGITTHMMRNIQNFLDDPGSLTPNPAQDLALNEITRIANEEGDNRRVIVVRGGPGTGKTVVGFLSMLRLGGLGMNLRFVACNNPVTRVLRGRVSECTGDTNFNPLIRTPGQLKDDFDANLELDVLIADEAQSITQMSGRKKNARLEDMISNSRLSIFFIDERQMTDIYSYGTFEYISAVAKDSGATLKTFELVKQERCGRSSQFLPLVGAILGYEGEEMPDFIDFPFEVYDSARELREEVIRRNEPLASLPGHRDVEAALIASYCWNFASKTSPHEAMDIILDDGDFESQWNQPQGGPGDMQFTTDPDRDDRVGYPPEIQGQELDYAGLILGPDLVLNEDGELTIDPLNHSLESPCIPSKIMRTLITAMETRGEEIRGTIRNQYWVLMTRATRGLFLYSENEEVREYFRNIISRYDN